METQAAYGCSIQMRLSNELTGRVGQHTVSIAHVVQIIQGAKKQGLSTDAILQRAGIAPVLLESSLSRVTQQQYAQLIRVLRRVTRDELWGLTPHPLRLGSFVQICSRLVHCHTLGEALRVGLGLSRLLLQSFVPRLVVVGGIARIQIVGSQDNCDPLEDYAMRSFYFMAYGVMSWLVARRVPVVCVRLSGSYSYYPSEADRLLQTRIKYQARGTCLEIDAQWLDLPVVQTTESLQQFIQDAPGNLLVKYREQSSLADRIRRVLSRNVLGDAPTLTELGAHLKMAPQTLRRRLVAEGQSYQAIKDALRRDAAILYLAQADLTLSDIAIRLGYSEASTFHRAFKAWTGLAPGVYREMNLPSNSRN